MSIPDLGTLAISNVPITRIKPYAKNPRLHPPAQIALLKAGISRFGFVAPMLVTPDFDIIAGHGRLIAATELGMTEVPVIILPHLNEAEQAALRVADNAIAAKGIWSPDLLKESLSFVLDGDFGISEMHLGFEQGEIDFYLGADLTTKSKGEVAAPPPNRLVSSVTQPGFLWNIGGHRILCGDSTDAASFEILMPGEQADVGISDIPWNRKINGHVSGHGAIKHPEFAFASGEMTETEFFEFTEKAFKLQAAFSKPGALNYQFIDWRGVGDMIAAGKRIYDDLINICVWVKPIGGMGGLYRSRQELVCVFRVKGGKHQNFVNLGKHGRNRSNVWEFASPSALGSERENLALHPTCKNVEMIGEAIMDSTRRKAIVLDAFLGSGTTVLAAQRTGRRGYGIEIDPYSVDVAVRRLQAESGLIAKLPDGRSFNEIEEMQKGARHDEA